MWEKRPTCLTPLVYQWCSTISHAIETLEPNDIPAIKQALHEYRFQYVVPHKSDTGFGTFAEAVFSHTRADCDRLCLGHTSHPDDELPQDVDYSNYACILPIVLEIGLRLAGPSRDWAALSLGHTSHHERMFDIVFSGQDDETISDAVGVWITDRNHILFGLCARYLAKSMERETAFSPRLRRVVIHALQRNWNDELTASGSEVIYLLNRLKVGMDDVGDGKEWIRLLVGVIRSSPGLERLSLHHWDLLYNMMLIKEIAGGFLPVDVEVVKFLEEAEDWERMEVWIVTMWWPPYNWFDEEMEDIEQVTLKLLSQRPSLLPKLKIVSRGNSSRPTRLNSKRYATRCERIHSLRRSPRRCKFLLGPTTATLF